MLLVFIKHSSAGLNIGAAAETEFDTAPIMDTVGRVQFTETALKDAGV